MSRKPRIDNRNGTNEVRRSLGRRGFLAGITALASAVAVRFSTRKRRPDADDADDADDDPSAKAHDPTHWIGHT